jgi:hypothetical protein
MGDMKESMKPEMEDEEEDDMQSKIHRYMSNK